MSKAKDIAALKLGLLEDPTASVNMYQRLDPVKDYIINVGEDVYGVFNEIQNTIGYDQKNHYTILSDGTHIMVSEESHIKTKELNITTSPYGLKWNGLSMNPQLLETKLTYISEKMIGNLININNNVQGLPIVDGNDIKSYDVFTSGEYSMSNKLSSMLKKYPVLNTLQWKYKPLGLPRLDLTPDVSGSEVVA